MIFIDELAFNRPIIQTVDDYVMNGVAIYAMFMFAS